MSYTTMYKIGADGQLERLLELSNSWGAAAYVWSALSERYLGGAHSWMMDGKPLWALHDSPRLSPHEQAVLCWTFDRWAVRTEDAARCAADMRQFVNMYPPAGVVCHLPAIADALDELALANNAMGACWNQTSTSESVWREGYEFDPEFDDPDSPDDYSRPVYHNFTKPGGHWWLYHVSSAAGGGDRMSDFDAVLSALDDLRIIPGHVVVTPVTAAAVAYARAAVACRHAHLGGTAADWRARAGADDAQEAAWLALCDAVAAAEVEA